MNVAPPPRVHDMPRSGEQQVDALLLTDHADVPDEELLAEPPFRLGRQLFHPPQGRTAADDRDLARRLAAALDRDPPIRFVRCDRAVRGPVRQALEPAQGPVPEAALIELRLVELRIDVVVIENELLPEQLERQGDQKDQIRRIARMNDVEA